MAARSLFHSQLRSFVAPAPGLGVPAPAASGAASAISLIPQVMQEFGGRAYIPYSESRASEISSEHRPREERRSCVREIDYAAAIGARKTAKTRCRNPHWTHWSRIRCVQDRRGVRSAKQRSKSEILVY